MLEAIFTNLEQLISSDTSALSAFAVWFITFIGGENGGLLSIAMAFRGYIDISEALVFTFLGSLSADVFWYGVTMRTILPVFDRWSAKKKKQAKDSDGLQFFSIADKHPYLLLIFIKFMVGLRLILTIYVVAKHRIPFYRYLLCNALANTLFVLGLYILVWFFEQGTEAAMGIERGFSGLLTMILLVTVGGNILLRLLRRAVTQSLKQNRTN